MAHFLRHANHKGYVFAAELSSDHSLLNAAMADFIERDRPKVGEIIEIASEGKFRIKTVTLCVGGRVQFELKQPPVPATDERGE